MVDGLAIHGQAILSTRQLRQVCIMASAAVMLRLYVFYRQGH